MNALRFAPGPWPFALAAAVAVLVALRAFGGGFGGSGDGADATAPLVWTAVPDGWLAGLESLRAGDAKQALLQLRSAEAELEKAPPELLRVRLAAALAAADGVDAEATAEKLAMRANAESLAAFVRGLAEFARCQLATRQAKLPGGDPGAFDRAIRTATESARAFVDACVRHEDGDWPAARRNAERVLAVRADLVRQQEQQKRDQQKEKDPDRPEPRIEPQEVAQELPPPDEQTFLSPADLQALLQRLATAENEKRGVRRAVRDARSVAVEQDW